MLYNTQLIIQDALKRAIRRESSMTSLEMPDLLYAVESKLFKIQEEVKSIS